MPSEIPNAPTYETNEIDHYTDALTEAAFTERWADRPRRFCPRPHVMPSITMQQLMAGR